METSQPGSNDLVVISRIMSWCTQGEHKNCKRRYRRWMVDNKTNKVIWLDEEVVCACKTRGCACYVKPADRPAPAKKRVQRRKK